MRMCWPPPVMSSYAATPWKRTRVVTAGVPIPGTEKVRMNLYFFRYSPEPPQSDVEVVIERFQYLP